MTTTHVTKPDLTTRPFHLSCDRCMRAAPQRLYCAWTEQLDHWFATPGTVLLRPELNAPYFFETLYQGTRHPHYGRILRLEPHHRIDMTWVTTATHGAETVLVLEFEPSALGTHLRLTHSGFDDEASMHRHEIAWPRVLERLDTKIGADAA
ncbi:MAG TPA: SRPBCC domain-containing protein [Steroidobacteraceae bacterium]|nr:SRPBCC domain-containing protein [Steroidobacteraceae bacterium]